MEELRLLQTLGFKLCERNWGLDSSLHPPPSQCMGTGDQWLMLRPQGQGFRTWDSCNQALQIPWTPDHSPPQIPPLPHLFSGLRGLPEPFPGFWQDLLTRTPHPAQTRGQVPQSRSQHPTPGSVLPAPPPPGLGPRLPSPARARSGRGLARPQARVTAAAGDPAHASQRLQELGWPERSCAPIG